MHKLTTQSGHTVCVCGSDIYNKCTCRSCSVDSLIFISCTAVTFPRSLHPFHSFAVTFPFQSHCNISTTVLLTNFYPLSYRFHSISLCLSLTLFHCKQIANCESLLCANAPAIPSSERERKRAGESAQRNRMTLESPLNRLVAQVHVKSLGQFTILCCCSQSTTIWH